MHFKIHVPEIINHQVHTKTVFIHIHKLADPAVPKKPKPKEEAPKTYHKEAHHEEWSSWKTHDYHSDHNDKAAVEHNFSKNSNNHVDGEVHQEGGQEKTNPMYQYHRDSYLPVLQQNDKPVSNYLKQQPGDMVGYSYPPQYAVQEDVNEIDHNVVEPYVHTYEEGYQRGGEAANGHTYSSDQTKFYDDKYDEGDQSVEEYKKDSKEKTNAGRYFADDDSEYQHSNRYQTEKRVSPRIFVT